MCLSSLKQGWIFFYNRRESSLSKGQAGVLGPVALLSQRCGCCSVGEGEPTKCSESRSLPSSCGSAANSKSPAVKCKAGWLAWCNHGLGAVSWPRWRINCVYSYRNGQLWSFCSSTHHASLPHLWVLIVWGCLCLTFQKHWLLDASSEGEWGLEAQAYDTILTY